jgi:hypothetical protein
MLFFLALFVAPPGSTQPTAISPQDVSLLKQRTDFTDNWSDTTLFDLRKPMEIFVTISSVNLPEEGNAELFFTIDSLGRGIEDNRFDSERIFVGVMQVADEMRRLKIAPRAFERGVHARITGWPATKKNVTDTVILIDTLELLKSGDTLRFHASRPGMQSLEPLEPAQ